MKKIHVVSHAFCWDRSRHVVFGIHRDATYSACLRRSDGTQFSGGKKLPEAGEGISRPGFHPGGGLAFAATGLGSYDRT